MKPTPGQESPTSPTAWRVTEAGYLASEGEGFVELITPFVHDAHRDKHGGPSPRARANAEYIARAVNSHEAMLHALRVAGTMLDHVLNGQTVPDSDDINAALFTVREAIRAGEMK